MTQTALEFIGQMRRDIQRWESDLLAAEANGAIEIVKVIRAWIDEGKKLLDGLGG